MQGVEPADRVERGERGEARVREWVLLDSGSCLKACPATYAPQVPLEPLHGLQAFAVNGQQLLVHGTKRVELELRGGYKLIVRFVAMDVAKPILSIGDLKRQGLCVNMDGRSTLGQGRVHVDIEECDGLFFLEAKPSQELKQQCAAVVPSPRMHFTEWCCEPDSRLTTWLVTRGCTATRLHLPHGDMRRQDSAEHVLKEVRDLVAAGVNVVLWMALPCTAWSRWQQVNLQTGAHTAELINAAREESKGMLQKMCWALRQILGPARPGRGQVHAVYEWPRGA